MLTRATKHEFHHHLSKKTSVAPLAIIGDSKTYLSQSDALYEKWKSPGDRRIQSLQNLDTQVFERYFKIKIHAFIGFLVSV